MSDVNAPGAVGDAGAGEPNQLPTYFEQLNKKARQQLVDEYGMDGLPKTISELALRRAETIAGAGSEVSADAGKQGSKPDVPESPDGYTFDEIKLPDGTQKDPLFESYLREIGVKGQLTQEQAKTLYASFHEQYLTGVRSNFQQLIEKQKPEAEKLLRDAWKDDYDAEAARADKVLQTFGDEDLRAAFNGSAPKIQAVMKRFMARIGDKMSPDTFVIPEGPADAPKPKPGQFQYGYDPTRK